MHRHGAGQPPDHRPSSSEAASALVESTMGLFDPQATAIELTGGVDSRLVLALCIAADRTPRLAITFGPPESEDVVVAAMLCRAFGIEHVILKPEWEAEQLTTDAEQFVTASHFYCNAAAYGWLPKSFRQLSELREWQLSGVGGECAATFYAKRHDLIVRRFAGLRNWVQLRLIKGAEAAQRLFQADIRRDIAEIADDVEASFQSRSLNGFIQDGRRFYREQRVSNWAVPALWGSSRWYRPVAPLLSNEYQAWAANLRADQLKGRQGQIDLTHRLVPRLKQIPYAGAREKTLLSRMRQLWQWKGRGEAVMASTETARLLLHSADVMACVHRLAHDGNVGLRLDLERFLREGEAVGSHEMGAICTAAIAFSAIGRS